MRLIQSTNSLHLLEAFRRLANLGEVSTIGTLVGHTFVLKQQVIGFASQALVRTGSTTSGTIRGTIHLGAGLDDIGGRNASTGTTFVLVEFVVLATFHTLLSARTCRTIARARQTFLETGLTKVTIGTTIEAVVLVEVSLGARQAIVRGGTEATVAHIVARHALSNVAVGPLLRRTIADTFLGVVLLEQSLLGTLIQGGGGGRCATRIVSRRLVVHGAHRLLIGAVKDQRPGEQLAGHNGRLVSIVLDHQAPISGWFLAPKVNR